MVQAKKKATQAGKKRKKIWYHIVATKMFNEAQLGETTVAEAANIMNKPLKMNLMNLTNDIKKQNTNFRFRVTEIKGDKAIAEPVGYEIMPTAIKRFIRRQRDRIDDSLVCITSDKKKVRLKPLVVTRGNTTKSVRTVLRKRIHSILLNNISRQKYEHLFSGVISYKLQANLRDGLKKTHPIRSAEIRVMKLLGEATPEEIKALNIPKQEEREAEPKKDKPKKEEAEEDKPLSEPKKKEVKEEKPAQPEPEKKE